MHMKSTGTPSSPALENMAFYFKFKSKFKPQLSTPQFEVEKFDGKIIFNIWARKFTNVLIQQGLVSILEAKPFSNMTIKYSKEILVEFYSIIELYLANNIFKNVLGT